MPELGEDRVDNDAAIWIVLAHRESASERAGAALRAGAFVVGRPSSRQQHAAKRKFEPRPGVLVTVRSPPISLAIALDDGEAEPGAAIAPGDVGVGLHVKAGTAA